jgi:short-subunit dehydrogenase
MQKRIFVSGASKGIGLAIALRFASQGFNVAISARNQDSLTRIQQSHPNIQTFRADMVNKAEVENLARWLNESFGPLDVLVNNVGRFIPGQIHTESDELFEELMMTNLYSNYYLTKRVLPSMIARQSGTIFNICSIASLIAYPNSGAYSISKHALHGLSKVLREEMKPYGIRVVSVLPGATLTASWEGVNLPSERFMPAEDIAQVVWDAWSLSPRTVIEEILLRPMLGDIQ